MKICTQCKVEKDLTEFSNHTCHKDGKSSQCKVCVNKKTKAWREKNKEKKKILDKEYRLKNKEKLAEKTKLYAIKNKEAIAKRVAIWRIKNKDAIAKRVSLYALKNKEKIRKRTNCWQKSKTQNDPIFKLTRVLRSRVQTAVKNNYSKKSFKTIELVGASIDYVRKHLESQFVDGMSWDNHGEWHIDHIKPCASFDLSDPDQQKECFNYKNLQPLWAEDNLRKGDFYQPRGA